MRRQLWVQGVDSLYHQHIARLQLQFLSALDALARRKIIFRQIHLLTTEEGIELVVEQVEIQRIDALKIIFSILILRGLIPVHEIIIERNLQRFQSVYGKLNAQALAGCCLTGRRRTGKKHELHTLALGNILSNLSQLLLLQCLADIDDVGSMTGFDSLIEVAHGSDAQDFLPAMMLLEDVEHLVLPGHLAQLVRILERRNAQEHAVIIFLQAEEIELGGIGEQCSVIIIHVFTYFIIGSIDRARSLEQFYFFHISLFLKQGDGIFRRNGEPANRHPGIDNLLHAAADDIHILIHNRPTETDIHIKAVGNRNINHHICSRIDILHRLAKYEEEGAGIGTGT